jgi:hypothetical protein
VITYSATLDVPTDTATLLTDLLIPEGRRRGTGIGTRAASCCTQAILVLRWFREDNGMPSLAREAGVSQATGYRYLHEGIDMLAARAPQSAADPATRRRRTRHRPAQDPVESATPRPPVRTSEDHRHTRPSSSVLSRVSELAVAAESEIL